LQARLLWSSSKKKKIHISRLCITLKFSVICLLLQSVIAILLGLQPVSLAVVSYLRENFVSANLVFKAELANIVAPFSGIWLLQTLKDALVRT